MEEVYQQLKAEFPPTCQACKGTLKPEVVFFGESLPSEVLSDALAEASQCDLFLVIGSSLVVQPAATLPVMAQRKGAKLAIINKDPTPLDAQADLVFHNRASEILEKVV